MIKKAIVLAAGKGTRFRPYTDYVAKEMLPIVDAPALGYILKEAADSGISEICVVSAPEKETVNRFISVIKDEFPCEISVVYQEKPDGTGSAVLLAEKFCDGQPAIVMNGDDIMFTEKSPPVTTQIIGIFEKDPSRSVIGVQKVPREEISRYGIISPAENDGISPLVGGIVEKPASENAPSDLAALGRYAITPQIFDVLRNLPRGHNGEYVLTDAFNALAAQNLVRACEFEGKRYDLGNKNGYLQAVTDFALRREDVGPAFREYLSEALGKTRN